MGNSAQTPCSAGTYNVEYHATSCDAVPQGTFASGTGNVNPTGCPIGTSTISVGATSVNDCIIDSDVDGTPDATDTDDDNDGVTDIFDAFPTDPSEDTDTDSDNIGDNADPDDDNDGVLDIDDPFPLDETEFADNDLDGIGDNADTDDDQDNWSDSDEDTCGSDSLDNTSLPIDFDGDLICDVMDGDDDGDNVPDSIDQCLGHNDQLDWDSDGIPDGCDQDMDIDADGINNDMDLCDFTPVNQTNLIDENGCGPYEGADDDHDGVPNSIDMCSNTLSTESPNPTGCGASQRDTDGDGWKDSEELGCGTDPLDNSDSPNESDSCLTTTTSNDSSNEKESSSFGTMSKWIIPILLIIVILVALLIVASRRRKAAEEEDDEHDIPNDLIHDGLIPIAESNEIDDWDEDEPSFSDIEDDDVDDEDDNASEKEEELARIASRAENIDFDTIGIATSDDSNDLQQISGVGPFMVEKLNALGIYNYQQIANMTSEIEDQVNVAIEFFPGRIKRDNWVGQATELAGASESKPSVIEEEDAKDDISNDNIIFDDDDDWID
jgi:predicted flap endonuclease-1-like 5' DNA nuclease